MKTNNYYSYLVLYKDMVLNTTWLTTNAYVYKSIYIWNCNCICIMYFLARIYYPFYTVIRYGKLSFTIVFT